MTVIGNLQAAKFMHEDQQARERRTSRQVFLQARWRRRLTILCLRASHLGHCARRPACGAGEGVRFLGSGLGLGFCGLQNDDECSLSPLLSFNNLFVRSFTLRASLRTSLCASLLSIIEPIHRLTDRSNRSMVAMVNSICEYLSTEALIYMSR